jgi:hypothetical protein
MSHKCHTEFKVFGAATPHQPEEITSAQLDLLVGRNYHDNKVIHQTTGNGIDLSYLAPSYGPISIVSAIKGGNSNNVQITIKKNNGDVEYLSIIGIRIYGNCFELVFQYDHEQVSADETILHQKYLSLPGTF